MEDDEFTELDDYEIQKMKLRMLLKEAVTEAIEKYHDTFKKTSLFMSNRIDTIKPT